MSKLKITKEYPFSKVGVQEIGDLLPTMRKLVSPIQEVIKEHIYWNDCDFEESEYKSRDGFIPYSHNCGGLELTVVIPKSESYEFEHLVKFGECEDCQNSTETNKHGDTKLCGYAGVECGSESEGYLDAKLRIWFKFEGLNEDGEMEFYLYCGGGNDDAPYFRTKYEKDVFEASFTAKTIAGISKAAKPHIQKLVNKIKGVKS